MSRSIASRHLTAYSLLPKAFGIATPRCFSQTTPRCDDARAPPPRAPASQSLLDSLRPSNNQSSSAMQGLARSLGSDHPTTSSLDTSALTRGDASAYAFTKPEEKADDLEPYHMHVYSHKHNTHITVTTPERNPIISLSCGNLGYRKARRGLYDSAYSTTKYVFERLVHNGWQPKINRLELVLRGFGQGREAAVKVIMSPEGKAFRDKIVRVADSTRVKFAGTRSPKPKRR